LAEPPWPLGALRTPAWVRFLSRWAVGGLGLGGLLVGTKASIKAVERAFSAFPFTPLQNVTGQPSMSVPLEWSSTGLPIGLSFSGRYGEETTLFRLAAQLEAARPWASRLPPICGQAS
jgi:amidase